MEANGYMIVNLDLGKSKELRRSVDYWRAREAPV